VVTKSIYSLTFFQFGPFEVQVRRSVFSILGPIRGSVFRCRVVFYEYDQLSSRYGPLRFSCLRFSLSRFGRLMLNRSRFSRRIQENVIYYLCI
jgi:hypothetical protein